MEYLITWSNITHQNSDLTVIPNNSFYPEMTIRTLQCKAFLSSFPVLNLGIFFLIFQSTINCNIDKLTITFHAIKQIYNITLKDLLCLYLIILTYPVCVCIYPMAILSPFLDNLTLIFFLRLQCIQPIGNNTRGFQILNKSWKISFFPGTDFPSLLASSICYMTHFW